MPFSPPPEWFRVVESKFLFHTGPHLTHSYLGVKVALQFTPLLLELSLIRSPLLWGEFSAFSAADAIHNFSNFHSTRYPSLLGGQRRHGMRGFAQHLYTLINFSDLRELVNFPCATIGVGDCEANQSSWHEAFVLQECPLGGTTLDALLCSLHWLFV